MKQLHYNILLLFTIFFININAKADTWKGACETDFPPYNYQKNGQNIGMDTKIVELVMKKMKNITYSFETFPWARVLKTLEEGNIDFAWQFVDTPERREKFILVGPIRDGKTVFIVPRDSNIKDWKNLEDFKGKTFAVVREFKYTSEFDNSTLFTKEISNNNKQLIKKLAEKRVDIAIGDFNTLTYEATETNYLDKIRFLNTPLKVVPRYIAFSKKNADKAKMFQKQLDIEKNTPEYNEIIQKYSK